VGTNALSAAAITSNLKTRFVGQRVLYYPSVPSTMDVARQEVQLGAPEGTVIIADEQTAGRGRLQRSWLTPQGNVALSVILYPALTQLPSLIMLASLAVVHCIRTVFGLDPVIKWPNDVLINGRKVCGILIESDVRQEKVRSAVIGIGLNVSLHPTDYLDIQDIATSLSQESGRDVSAVETVCALLVEIECLYMELAAGKSLYEEWRDNLVTLGQAVRASSGKNVYEGIAESVAPDGSLLLRDDKGKHIKIVAGDVTLRS
jgi:BirA family transcriptional regulator, biotin operon repressor / biotin---[acetyl-CoA-carboxylase] ligase